MVAAETENGTAAVAVAADGVASIVVGGSYRSPDSSTHSEVAAAAAAAEVAVGTVAGSCLAAA